MTRQTLLVATAAIALLAGCNRHTTPATEDSAQDQATALDNGADEDVSPDSLAAPDNMAIDSESNGTDADDSNNG